MNGPCKINFHEDAAPLYGQLPERYRPYVCDPNLDDNDIVLALYSQHAFYIDFTNGAVLRTRVNGKKETDPVDFPMTSVAWVEWFMGSQAPPPLTPYVGKRA